MSDKPQVNSLRSLSPIYIEEQHADYVGILKAVLTQGGADAPCNIALTGHYGSGKSSVLVETQRRLSKDGKKTINLSLPSLGIGNGRIPKDGDHELDKTNLIQKEIVKQLLYRRNPAKTPASRYNRLDTFGWKWATARAGIVGLAAAGLALVTKLPNKITDALPPTFWAWADKHWGGNFSEITPWLSLGAVFVLAGAVTFSVQRLLQQKFRVSELAAGPTKVTLSASSMSYFDEYLDEIVYFFQTSKTSVVIFEDLDRFKDPHIFETLRELNVLLNNAEQTGSEPVRFVYAIRDSIFEELDVDTDRAEREELTGALPGDLSDNRRLMSTNRTKFFDLVVPMVPFISHRTSRDLIRQEVAKIESGHRPSGAVIDLVGSQLTDMRLIKNICNEYEIFQRRILRNDGLKELTADRLFASIVYKNLYLGDYEKIQFGTSRLDLLYSEYRNWVSHQIMLGRRDERTARVRLQRIDSIAARSDRVGHRLQDVLEGVYPQAIDTNRVTIDIAGTNHAWTELTTPDFWRSFLQSSSDLTLTGQPGHQAVVLTFEKLPVLMRESLSQKDWDDSDRAEIFKEIDEATKIQRHAAHSSLRDALADVDRTVPYKGKEQALADIAATLFPDAELARSLLEAGYIDENFTLYVTQFPGESISASAMNFILKAVQPDLMDIEYHFGHGGNPSGGDIDSVLASEGPRLLGGRSVYNIEIFDHLLAKAPTKLDAPVRRLAASGATDTAFIDAYLTSGAHTSEFVQRLAAVWPTVFTHLLSENIDDTTYQLLDDVLLGVRADTTYQVTPQQREAIQEALPHLAAVSSAQESDRSVAIAMTFAQLGVRVLDLGAVADRLRSELVTRDLYPVTLSNLRAAVGDNARIALDDLKVASPDVVYRHVLENLDDYIASLASEESLHAVLNVAGFVGVLEDIGEVNPELIESVARAAAPECMIEELSDLSSKFWPAVARAKRIALSATNLVAYKTEIGLDDAIAGELTAAEKIEVLDDGTPLVPLATDLLNTESLEKETKLALVASLKLESGAIAPPSLSSVARPLIPALVKSGEIIDGPDAFTCLGDDERPTKIGLMSASSNFANYMIDLDLSANDLLDVTSPTVPTAVKQVLLDNLDRFGPSLGQRGASALAAWAASTNQAISAEDIVLLATKGGPASAKSIVKLIGARSIAFDMATVRTALDALGAPYNQLASPGKDRPKVPSSDGLASLLAQLQKAGIVSKFQENTKKRVFDVSKRHS